MLEDTMRYGFIAVSLAASPAVLEGIRQVMPCATMHLRSLLSRVDPSKFNASVSLEDFSHAKALVNKLLDEVVADTFVCIDRSFIRARFRDLPEHSVNLVFRLIVYVRQANSFNAQFATPKAWLLNGMGFWTKVFPGFCVELLEEVVAEFNAAGIDLTISGPAHLICVPKGGKALPLHIDGKPAKDLLYELQKFVDFGGIKNVDFASQNGVQTLVHLSGGRPGRAATCMPGPLTPSRLIVLFEVLRDMDPEFWHNEKEGPKWFNLTADIKEEYVRRIAAIMSSPSKTKRDENIRLDGFEAKLEFMPMVPSEDNGGPFAIMIPEGFPHMKQEGGPRTGMAGGLSTKNHNTSQSQQSEQKRKGLYIHRQSRMAFDEKAAMEVAAEKRPFSNGATHKIPGYAADLMTGAFKSICFTPDQADRLCAAMGLNPNDLQDESARCKKRRL